jgi:transposase-like protein
LKPIHIRKSQYLNNRIEQDHRRIKRRARNSSRRSPPEIRQVISLSAAVKMFAT